MQNTVTVTVHRYVIHDKYAKRFPCEQEVLADTNGMELNMGDEVVIAECRHVKRKCFKVSENRRLTSSPKLKEDAEKGIKRDHRDSVKSSASSGSLFLLLPPNDPSSIHPQRGRQHRCKVLHVHQSARWLQRRYAGVGDIIVVAIKSASPRGTVKRSCQARGDCPASLSLAAKRRKRYPLR